VGLSTYLDISALLQKTSGSKEAGGKAGGGSGEGGSGKGRKKEKEVVEPVADREKLHSVDCTLPGLC